MNAVIRRARAGLTDKNEKRYILVAGRLVSVVLDSGADAGDRSFIPKRIIDQLDPSNEWEWTSRDKERVTLANGEPQDSLGVIRARVVAHGAHASVIHDRLEFNVFESADGCILLSREHLARMGYQDPNTELERVQRQRVATGNDALARAIRAEGAPLPTRQQARHAQQAIRQIKLKEMVLELFVPHCFSHLDTGRHTAQEAAPRQRLGHPHSPSAPRRRRQQPALRHRAVRATLSS